MTTSPWRIPLFDLNYSPVEERAIVEVLRSKWLSMGPKTEEFEHGMAKYLGVKHAICVSNGTCALQLAYLAAAAHLDAPAQNLSVAVPDITFVATANAALAAGCAIHLTDIQAADRPMLKLNHGSQTSAQVACAVHFAGFDAFATHEVGNNSSPVIIEDAAHAIGARNAEGKHLGTTRFAGCFSFFSNKNLATGEGGMVVTNDDNAASLIRLLRSHGMTSLTWERHKNGPSGYDVLQPGYNFRCTEITAALGLAQLTKLDADNEIRRGLYKLYGELLHEKAGLIVPFQNDLDLYQPACHILPLLCPSASVRDSIKERLTKKRVQTSHHYPSINSFAWYQNSPHRVTQETNLTSSAEWASRELTLPLFPGLSRHSVEEICACIVEVAMPEASA